MNHRDRDLKYIRISHHNDETVVVLTLPSDFRKTALAGKRSDNARKWFRRCKRVLMSHHSQASHLDEFNVEWNQRVAAKIRSLDTRLRAIFDAPVSARTARQVLGLSSEDFIQLVKDGTLPAHSRQRVGGPTSSFSVPVFDPDAVELLRQRNEHLASVGNNMSRKTD